MLFPVICGTPRGSSRLGRYGLVKLEAPKNGQEALVGYKSMNERVKWLQQEISRSPKFKGRGYLEKV
jgi:hypothetical protein